MNEKLDVLGRDGIIDKLITLVNSMSENKQGCCFAIDGAWGSGKSFVMKKFEDKIKMMQSEETIDNRYFLFNYDCWKYDYYEEPVIAIIAAMLDATNEELSFLSAEAEKNVKLAWETTKGTLTEIARELCKNKIGIDLVEIATGALSENDNKNSDTFDSLYGFKRALEKTRKGIQKIANDKTVVIIVDELDRCLPTYTIKILERLHHIFNDLHNVIVIVSMDKVQIEHSINEIYGEIDVDTYLRKLIEFKVNLDKGKAVQYIKKYALYASMFEITQNDEQTIENFFANLMDGLDMRTQERIFNKAEIIHRLINNGEVKDGSIMTFEILFLTVSLRLKSDNLNWLVDNSHHVDQEKVLGEGYYRMLKDYEKQTRSTGGAVNSNACIIGDINNKTFFWVAICNDIINCNLNKVVS